MLWVVDCMAAQLALPMLAIPLLYLLALPNWFAVWIAIVTGLIVGNYYRQSDRVLHVACIRPDQGYRRASGRQFSHGDY